MTIKMNNRQIWHTYTHTTPADEKLFKHINPGCGVVHVMEQRYLLDGGILESYMHPSCVCGWRFGKNRCSPTATAQSCGTDSKAFGFYQVSCMCVCSFASIARCTLLHEHVAFGILFRNPKREYRRPANDTALLHLLSFFVVVVNSFQFHLL